MDAQRFDDLSRTLAGRTSRRAALAGGLVALRGVGGAAAEPRKKRRSGKNCANLTPGADLARCEFPRLTVIADKDLTGANLASAKFGGVEFRQVRFVNANMPGVRGALSSFTECDLSDASLMSAWLVGSRWDGSRFDRATLVNAEIGGAVMQGVSLVGATLDGANLENARIVSADLTGASLRDASLVDILVLSADLTDADLTGASLALTDLAGAILCRTVMPDGAISNRNCPGA